LSVNARGVFLGMKFAIPLLKAVGGGSIVNISSISGITGQHHVHIAYNASKGAVRTLTKAPGCCIARLHPQGRLAGKADPLRRTGRDHVACQQRRPIRAVRDQGRDVEDQIVDPGVLDLSAVEP
jgi:hypothetical protein